MRQIVFTSRFRKDYKLAVKRGWDLSLLEQFVQALASDAPLPPSARPHKLSGDYGGTWDAHIKPDWILIYEINDNELQLRRTGTHADLFQ